jgi:hypothetical protein
MLKSNESFLRPTHRLEHFLLERSSASNLVSVHLRIKEPQIQRCANEGPVERQVREILDSGRKKKETFTLHLRSDLSRSDARQPYKQHLQCLGPRRPPSSACACMLFGGNRSSRPFDLAWHEDCQVHKESIQSGQIAYRPCPIPYLYLDYLEEAPTPN